ncbi:hypothetical protein ABI_17650 [Asticcacaulis biprosthecium C19]|uniref:Tetratricopeptide repeat family protein n=1 Tax=Asticcacaulis biprosthecium C19 TaxID=715226 RepID=F4QKM3_9CAUL|nr:hypothetical protein [Asticcacaulis biprosthecium]EGF93325.1 hypothetical protein ABI_17650 [Asticcacaulis biprosthecium C19]
MKTGRKVRWYKGLGIGGMAVAMALGAAAPAFSAADAPETSPGTAIAIMQAAAALQGEDCVSARAPLNLLWNDPYLDQADPNMAAQMRAALIVCTAQTDGMKAAIALSASNIKRTNATVAAYDLHVFLLMVDGQVLAAGTSLNEGLERFPTTAPALTDMTVLGLLVQLSAVDGEASFGLLNRLQDVRWQAHNPAMRPLIGFLRVEGLRKAIAVGDDARARLYRQDIAQDSLVYVIAQGDGELSDPSVPPIDVRPVIVREIEANASRVAGNPAELMGLRYLIMLERANDQSALALTQLDGILNLVDQYGLQNFQSVESYPGLLTDKGSLLADLGRYVDADKAFKDGAAKLTPEYAIDHNLIFMNYLTDSGREKDALNLAATLVPEAMEQDDRYQLVATRACAYAYAGDEPAYAQAVEALATQPLLRVKPALCAGDSEGAAKALIAAINDPDSRLSVIMFMQNGLPALPFGERDKGFIAAMQAVKTRSDVVAAAQAARINIRTWPLRF